MLASQTNINLGSLLAVLAGTALVIASACVINNYIDRDIDAAMERTRERALVTGRVPATLALLYAAILATLGFSILLAFTNYLTVVLGLVGYLSYLVLYGIAKRRSVHGTLVGSISGAMPPVAGYTAAANQLDSGALILFLILVFWQMPHFYAIAIYRLKDYKAAGLPVLPAVRGIIATKRQMLAYIMAFIVASCSLTLFEYTGYVYLLVVLPVGLRWLQISWQGQNIKASQNNKWARKMFGFSLIVTITMLVALSLGARLP